MNTIYTILISIFICTICTLVSNIIIFISIIKHIRNIYDILGYILCGVELNITADGLFMQDNKFYKEFIEKINNTFFNVKEGDKVETGFVGVIVKTKDEDKNKEKI